MLLTKQKLEYGLPLAITLLVVITVLQDLIASILLDRGFYLSESLLFKIVWMLFLPAVFLLWYGLKRLPYRPTRRWLYPGIALGMAVGHLLLAGALTAGIAQLFMRRPFTFKGVEEYLLSHQGLPVLCCYLIMVAGIVYLRHRRRQADELPASPPDYPEFLSVRQGKKVIPVPVEAIQYIQSENPYCRLVTHGGKYLMSTSLKQLHSELDPGLMLRVHRSTIVNVREIRELRSRSNGDYDILLHSGVMLRWSRNYADGRKELLHLAR
ncbi:LytR/AlgR family response regulator transcription factor [Flavilitoribacter nigricans]|uniref:HTH LytTR-type domain-containing protein n=1 Tax=Flavilitoribacter nigricans (strain ATCC 23147 / DSM 23189 / NBRC 102662 / NCIMB 1420 / SS-2) TaxID=1122177 RepID=A0A2D0NAL9_FLAN2|nr:LytTR family DNA-binding domain-containing protein [Flavilitoribacter nigricans]PHN05428.1 hypothetical protein CRP01_15640 [Flavilitoribacter nigricans DSM 23189 = NBRC 102662]